VKRFPREMWDKDRISKAPTPAHGEEREERGVGEVVLRAKDWRGFELIDSTGTCIMYVEWPAARVTEDDIEGLWRTLEEMDPESPKLSR
jgi:hypothetical protein